MRQKLLALGVVAVGILVMAAQCNQRPVALYSVDRVDGPSPLTVQFDGSISYDPDGEIVSYAWDFDDNGVDSGQFVSHTFVSNTDHAFSVRLTVTDDKAATDSTTGSIYVDGSGPGPTPGETLFFDDFEDGADPAWSLTEYWELTDGELRKHPNSEAWAYVTPGVSWQDYQVEVTLNVPNVRGGVILRCSSDLQSFVLLYGEKAYIRCVTRVDGETVQDTGRIEPGFFKGEQSVRITVSGSTYRVYINGLLRLEYTEVALQSGMPGLYADGYTTRGSVPRFDDFRVTALD